MTAHLTAHADAQVVNGHITQQVYHLHTVRPTRYIYSLCLLCTKPISAGQYGYVAGNGQKCPKGQSS